MKACPRPVRFDVILDRIDSDSEGNVIDVYMSRIRKKLRAIDAPIPFDIAEGAGRLSCTVLEDEAVRERSYVDSNQLYYLGSRRCRS
jgi:hypothetical protein